MLLLEAAKLRRLGMEWKVGQKLGWARRERKKLWVLDSMGFLAALSACRLTIFNKNPLFYLQ
jgi:hypothetical protein